MSKIIVCSNCGQKNKIADDSANAKCGKCWSSLTSKESKKVTNEGMSGWDKFISWFIIIIVALIVIFVFIVPGKTSSSKPETHEKARNNYPVVSMPYSGKTQSFTNESKVAPLTIDTSAGSNYLVKIVDYYSKQEVMTVFVQGGDSRKIQVPLGVYEIKYASGEKWYGYQHLFGDDTSYSKAENSFKFEDTGYQITGYTITLYRVSNGNLRTSHINKSQF